MELFELSIKQQRAFNALKKAFKECEKAGLFFYNNYGTLGACSKTKVSAYNDSPSEYEHNRGNVFNPNEFILPCNEWADDAHFFHPV